MGLLFVFTNSWCDFLDFFFFGFLGLAFSDYTLFY